MRGFVAIAAGLLVAVFVGAFLDISEARAKTLQVLAVLVLATVIFPFLAIKRLRARQHRSGWFRVSGCHRKFLDQLPPVIPLT